MPSTGKENITMSEEIKKEAQDLVLVDKLEQVSGGSTGRGAEPE